MWLNIDRAACLIRSFLSKLVRLFLSRLSAYFWLRTIRLHYSRLGRDLAPKYTAYLNVARIAYLDNGGCKSLALPETSQYHLNGFTHTWDSYNQALAESLLAKVQAEEQQFGGESVWQNDLRYARGDIFLKFPEVEALFKGQISALIENIFQAHFKIYYGVMYKSIRRKNKPEGSHCGIRMRGQVPA